MSDDKSRKSRRSGVGSDFRSYGSSRSMESYKRDLEKLFKPGTETPERFRSAMKKIEPEEDSAQAERKAAIKALKAVEGFREFSQAVIAFRQELAEKEWPWPDDEDLLIRMLDHPDERVLRDTLEHVADLSGRQGWERTVALKSRLGTIRTMTEDPRTHRVVAAVEQALEQG